MTVECDNFCTEEWQKRQKKSPKPKVEPLELKEGEEGFQSDSKHLANDLKIQSHLALSKHFEQCTN